MKDKEVIPLEEAAQNLRVELHRHGITAADVCSLLDSKTFAHDLSNYSTNALKEEAIRVLEENEFPSSHRNFTRLARLLDSEIDLGIGDQQIEHRASKLLRYAKRCFEVLVVSLVMYMLVGGLISAYETSWHLKLFGLVGLLFILSIYEGLQISVAVLRMKDLHVVRKDFPRAFRLQQLYKDERGTRRFFAGRQLIVVIVVFLAAQITSIPTPETFPGFPWKIPEWLRNSVGKIGWDYGIAGALFTLWLGQLTPQFVANNAPVRFLNLPGLRTALRVADFMDDVGLTSLGTWLSRKFGSEEKKVGISPREIYKQYAEELHGYGIIGIRKNWIISADSIRAEYETSAKFSRSGYEFIYDEGMVSSSSESKLTFKGHILSESGERMSIQYDEYKEETSNDELRTRRYRQRVKPKVGDFKKMDTLKLRTIAEFKEVGEQDLIHILRPTKYVSFRLEFKGVPDTLSPVVVQKYVADPVGGEYIFDDEYPIEGTNEGKETVIYEFIQFYPPIDSRYILCWKYSY